VSEDTGCMKTKTTCFAEGLQHDLLDRQPFKFGHKLLGHPALTLANLEQVLPALPSEHVYYSSGLLKESDDLDRAHIDHRNGLSLEETIESIRTSDSYIMVRTPEQHSSFAPLFDELRSDVEVLMRARGVGDRTVDPMLYLFIASPNSVTPFHVDRYSTFLMQFQGSKEVCVFPQWDERVASAADCEAFMAYAGGRPPWRPEADALGTRFHFQPGDTLHMPFMAGHYVRNGSDDVSISMSIIFNTAETVVQSRALLFNHSLRPSLRRLGLSPEPVGSSFLRDSVKANLWRAGRKAARVLGLEAR
jgi:hypothetical protein